MGDSDGSSNAAQSARQEENLVSGLFKRISRAFGKPSYTPDDQRAADPMIARDGFRSLANLTNLRVEDVMVPKVEITAVALDTDEGELVEKFRESGLTRLPVYKDTMDTPMGLVHLKDFALRHGFNGGNGSFDLQAMLRPLLYAPPSMPIGVLLQKMQTDRIHMALVIDEYGGVDGLVTIEDLIEQVVGEIEDEHDQEEAAMWVEEKPGCYLVRARAPLDEFEAEVGLQLVEAEDQEEIDTLGGVVYMLSGRIPARGEVVRHASGAEFEVVDADPRRIKRLRVRLPKVKESDARSAAAD